MKLIYVLIIALFFCWKQPQAQTTYPKQFHIGTYFSPLNAGTFIENGLETPPLWQYTYNLNLCADITRRWRFGYEQMLIWTNNPQLDNPFYNLGVNVDFKILPKARVNWIVRAGISTGNLSYAGDDLPTKRRGMIYRVIGTYLDIRMWNNFSGIVGYFNHFPLNSIEYKYGIALPFVGFKYRFINMAEN